jgi:YVTN family beta-propeller protein
VKYFASRALRTLPPWRLWAFILLALLLGSALPANATRLPDDLKQTIQDEFPSATIRLDGAIEAGRGDLFLPVIPATAAGAKKKAVKVVPEAVFPDERNPSAIFYNNGWCYLRVTKKGLARTISLPAEVVDKYKKHLLTCKLAPDLIVPENFVLPLSLKPIISNTAITTVNDASMASPDFGTPVKVAKPVAAGGPGLLFLTSLNTGTITLVDEKNFSKLADFPTEGTPCGMTFVDGRLYIADQAKSRILLLDPAKRQFLGQIDLPPKMAPKGIAALPNGKLIYVSESAANDIAIIETETRRVLMRTKVQPGPGRIAMTPNGNFLLVLNVPSGQITFISTLNQRIVGVAKVGTMPTSLDITKDSQMAYVSNRMSNTISVIDIPKRQVVATIPTGTGPTGLALSADESKLFVSNARENTISVFDTKSHQKLSDIKLPMDIDFPGEIRLMPDGKRILVSSQATDTIGLLDLQTLEFAKQCPIGHTSQDIVWVPAS